MSAFLDDYELITLTGYKRPTRQILQLRAMRVPHRVNGREIYVTDVQYKAVWDAADEPLRNAMDLIYLTGQRPADVLAMAAE